MKTKSGISLIAVLMFMLAATTASIAIFKWIGSENFSSAARLKQSEAYQASESGVDAVRAWLTNKAGDVGEMLRVYNKNNRPILLTGDNGSVNVLGTVGGSRGQQKYKVYLMKVDTTARNGPKKMEFLSVGMARDGSTVSQKVIFSVDGLYKTSISNSKKVNTGSCKGDDCDFDYAFFGGINTNTQGKFSSGVINGDFKASGISTNKTLIVTGNMEVSDNAERTIGCKSATDMTREGDLYVVGYWKAKGFTVCGNAYIGGLLSNENNQLRFRRSLYADGGIDSRGFSVDSNVTLGGDLTFGNDEGLSIGGNFVMEKYTLDTVGSLSAITKAAPKIVLSKKNAKMNVGGSFWSLDPVFSGTPADNGNDYNNLKYLGGTGKSLSLPANSVVNCGGTGAVYDCNNDNKRYYQPPPNMAYFSSNATLGVSSHNASGGNRPKGANPLPELAKRIGPCKGDGTKKCVPDPIEVPQEVKNDWVVRGKMLNKLVNTDNNVSGLPDACIRLVLNKTSCMAKAKNPSASCTTSPNNNDMGLGAHWGANSNSGNNFVLSANECYEKLNSRNGDPKKILFPESNEENDGQEKFLVVNVVNPNQISLVNAFHGNFIFVFEESMDAPMELPATTDYSKVFIYFKEGAKGEMPLNSNCQSPASNPCKRNYFIFSEKDIAGASGNATINGAIFLANGSKVTKNLPDTRIEFNLELFNSLKNVGAISMTEEYSAKVTDDDETPPEETTETTVYDSYYIPVSSRLPVTLVSKEISKQKDLKEPDYEKIGPSILVMPRVVYLPKDEISSSEQLKEYYSFMYLNMEKSDYLNKVNTFKDGPQTPSCCKGVDKDNNYACGAQLSDNGIYTCGINNTSSSEPISIFYVQVGGEIDRGWVSISQGGKATPGGDCMPVSLTAGKQGPLEVIVMGQFGDGGWSFDNRSSNCTGNYPQFTCTIPSGEKELKIFNVCRNSASGENPQVVLKISAENGTPRQSECTITLNNAASATIERFNPLNVEWEMCPYEPAGTWIDVSCGTSKVTSVPNNRWDCPENTLATWSITNVGDACKINNDYASGIVTVPAAGTTAQFRAALEWKSYTLTVNGGPANIASYKSAQNFSCNGTCSEPIYHKAAYEVTTPTVRGYCINNASCSPTNADGVVGPDAGDILYFDPTGNTAIYLVNEPPKSMKCTLNKPSIREGQSLDPGNFTVEFSGYGCNPQNPVVNFSPLSGFFAINAPYDITASSSECGGFTVICTPQLTVEANTGCQYQESYCGGKPFSSVLDNTTSIPSVGQCLFLSDFQVIQPELNSIVAINGERNVCGGDWGNCTYNTKPSATKDGGYYVYVENGNINSWQGNGWQNVVAGTKNSLCQAAPSSGSSGGVCAYQASWCDGSPATSDAVSTTVPPNGNTVNSCFFVSDISRMQIGPSRKINGVVTTSNNSTYFVCGQWGFGTCASLLPAKQDGGYYIRTGTDGWFSDSEFMTGYPQCGGGTSSATSSSSSAPSSSSGRTCNSYVDHPASVPSDYNNTCIKKDGKCYVCPENNNCSQTWYWGGTWDNGWPTQGWIFEVNPCPGGGTPSSSSSSPSISCSISGTYTLGSGGCVNVPTPTVSGCTSPSNLTFKINSTLDNVTNWSNVNVGTGGQFCSARSNTPVYMIQASCNGASANIGSAGILCGNITIQAASSSSVTPSSSSVSPATCTLQQSSGSNVYWGQDLAAPTVTCPGGASPSQRTFNNRPNANESWNNNSNSYYNNNAGTGTKNISVDAFCSGNWINSITCGNLNLIPPACTPPSGTFYVGSSVNAPTINCGGSTIQNRNFGGNVPDNNNQWSNGGTGSYNTAGTKNITLNSFQCGNNNLSNLNISCGSITIQSSSSATPSSSSGGGGGNTYTLSTAYQQLASGTVTINCSSQMGMECYANPVPTANVDLGCSPGTHNPISIWNSTSTGPTYIGQCITSITCTIPSDKTIYCRKQ
jgi:hypothetical protein